MLNTPSRSDAGQDFMVTLRHDLGKGALVASVLIVMTLAFISEGRSLGPIAQAYTLAMFALVAVCWLISRGSPEFGMSVFVAVLYATVALTPGWNHSDGTLALFVIPCNLASIVLSPVVGISLSCLSGAILIWGDGVIAAPSLAPRLITLAALGVSEGMILLVLANARHMQALASSSYYTMRAELIGAREQRMILKQTQEDLTRVNVELAGLADRQATLRQAADEARLAKETFVAHVSHELRTPLNMIIGFTELMVKTPSVYGVDLSQRLLGDLDVVYRNSKHLLVLINDVLDLTRMQRARRSLDLAECSLADITTEAVRTTAPLYDARGLYHRIEIPADLPPLICDRTRIRQVLLNLLSNAARYTERGGITITAQQQGDGSILVGVADTGSGIAQEDLWRVFEPYQRVGETTTRREEGSGLGLTISREIVEMHGGKMWIESTLGRGSTFYFSLPADAHPAHFPAYARWINPYQPYEARTRPSLALAPQVRRRFVVLENDDTLRDLLAHHMDPDDLVVCATPDRAVEQAACGTTHALVLNDHQVDESVLACLPFDLPGETPVIGAWIPGRGYLAHQLHAVDYLIKPVTPETLFGALARVPGDIETILIVDDELEARQLFSRVLASGERAYRVLQASNGMHALSQMRRRKPDVILLDMKMPTMDGCQLLTEMQRDQALGTIPVIIVSASDREDWPISCKALFVTRKGGLTGEEYVACLNAITQILNPEHRGACPASQETPPD